MDIVNGVIQILSCFSTPTCNYIDRHRKFKRNVDDLRRRVRDLNSRKEDIQAQLKALDLSEKQVRKQVEDWLTDVERINAEMLSIEAKVQKASYLCRGRTGGHVREEIEAVEAIYQQGSSLPDNLVIDKPRPPTIGTPLLVGNLEGEVDAKQQIWGYLNSDDVGVIGLWGIGGVGKTTITKHIHNELVKMEPRRFDIVIWVTVSHPLNIWKLQHDIAKEMGMEKSLAEDEEEMKRASQLVSIIERKKFVLILDDVWDKLSLEDVGIPKPTKENGCKVMVTSRSSSVCNFLGCRLVKVNPLSSQESLNLFLDKVGLGSEILEDSDLGEILSHVVNECAGLPLAIVVIAGTMKGVTDIHEWRNALRELRKCVVGGDMFEGQDDEIFNRLKFSYDRLPSSKVQNCFLWCSLYPEDFEIERTELIENWIDDGLIEESGSRREMHDRGHTILNRLENTCLLEKCSDEWGVYVKMHDVVRDMALRIKSSQFMVKARMKLKKTPDEHEWAIDVEKVSLMQNDIRDIPPNMSPKCPALSTLLLRGNEHLKVIPDCFFSNMPGLEVLNLSWCTFFEVLPSSISNLKNLTALVVHDGQFLKHVPSLVELKALKKLDLHWAKIETLPEGVETLVNLQYLDLDCENLVDLPEGMLRNLTRLQHLEAPPKAILRGEEVASLCDLEYLIGNLEVGDFNIFVSKRLETYTHFDLVVGGQRLGIHYGGNTVTLEGCEVRGGNRLVLPDNLRGLVINRCNFLKSLGDDFLQNAPSKLKWCEIYGCEGIECVADVGSLFSSFKLINIEDISLSNLPNLQVLVKLESDGPSTGASASPALKGPFSPPIFANLTELRIYGCPRMKKLIPLQLLQCLQNVKKIDVDECLEIEEIIGWEEEEFGNHITATLSPFIPKLESLKLSKLPELRRISPGREEVVFDSLKSIQIRDCVKLKRIPLYLFGGDQASPPAALEEIRVEPKEWWESLEWDDPNAKNVLQPFVKCHILRNHTWDWVSYDESTQQV